MQQQMNGKVLVIGQTKDDLGLAGSTMECKLAEVVRFSTDELEVVLPSNPRVGRLLTLQLFSDPEISSAIVAKVIAAKLRPQGGWLVHCTPVLPLTTSQLGTSLRPCVA
jgi:hypothetical protein